VPGRLRWQGGDMIRQGGRLISRFSSAEARCKAVAIDWGGAFHRGVLGHPPRRLSAARPPTRERCMVEASRRHADRRAGGPGTSSGLPIVHKWPLPADPRSQPDRMGVTRGGGAILGPGHLATNVGESMQAMLGPASAGRDGPLEQLIGDPGAIRLANSGIPRKRIEVH